MNEESTVIRSDEEYNVNVVKTNATHQDPQSIRELVVSLLTLP